MGNGCTKLCGDYENESTPNPDYKVENKVTIYNKRHFPEKEFGINLVSFLETKYK